jgi:hypothetical protein
MRAKRLFSSLAVLTVIAVALGSLASSCAHTTQCVGARGPSSYRQEPGDQLTTTHLSLARVFDGRGSLELNVCAGDLTVTNATGSNELQLEITLQSPGSQPLSDYVHTVDVRPNDAVIDLRTPAGVHPVVVLRLPSGDDLHTAINVGSGKVAFHADTIAGDRELNLGHGNAAVLVAGDRSYAQLTANVGFGSFHDHRPGGSNSYFIVSRQMEGDGRGMLAINVGAGSADLEPARD